MPRTTIAWMIAGAAIIGVPLTNGFVSKWLLFDAALSDGQWVVVAIAWLVSVVTAFYILKATVSVFFGNLPLALKNKPVQESPSKMQVGMLTLSGLCLIFGIAPQILNRWIVAPAVQGLGFAAAPALTWFGVHTLNGSASAILGALIVLTALLIGWIFVALSKNKLTSSAEVFTGGESLPANNTVGAEDFAAVAEMTLRPVYHFTDPDPVYQRLWDGIRTMAGWSEQLTKPLEAHPLSASFIIGLFLTAVVWFWK
jgi:multicomponent Na+:H+ antiporter subunit A